MQIWESAAQFDFDFESTIVSEVYDDAEDENVEAGQFTDVGACYVGREVEVGDSDAATYEQDETEVPCYLQFRHTRHVIADDEVEGNGIYFLNCRYR